ncbi:hypothetical protein LguiA_009676 [Lonicera macranthoides]
MTTLELLHTYCKSVVALNSQTTNNTHSIAMHRHHDIRGEDKDSEIKVSRHPNIGMVLTLKVDYGWGRSIWACTTIMPLKSVVILISIRFGDRIEAWMHVVENNIGVLEIHEPPSVSGPFNWAESAKNPPSQLA